MFAFSPEDFEQAKVLQEQIEEDNPYLFVPFRDVDKVKGISSGAQYILDKLQNQLDGRVNEILTMIGVNNIGIGEKKEHLIVDEVNANNEDIEQQSYSYTSELEDCFERVSKILAHKVQVIDLNDMFKQAEDETDENMMYNNDEEENQDE